MPRDNKGFTVIEVMVVMGISTFILASIYGISAMGGRSWLIKDGLLTVQQYARLGLDKMSMDLRQASSANVGADNRTVRFNIPIDADGDGLVDLIPGTNTIVYGADDFEDFDGDGILWEQDWNIEYQIDAVNNQIIRRVYTTNSAIASQRMVIRNINPASALTHFQTETGGIGIANEIVNIKLTTEIDNIQGVTLNPPLQVTLMARVNFRN